SISITHPTCPSTRLSCPCRGTTTAAPSSLAWYHRDKRCFGPRLPSGCAPTWNPNPSRSSFSTAPDVDGPATSRARSSPPTRMPGEIPADFGPWSGREDRLDSSRRCRDLGPRLPDGLGDDVTLAVTVQDLAKAGVHIDWAAFGARGHVAIGQRIG